MEQMFNLSKSNRIYFLVCLLVIIILSIGSFIVIPEKTPNHLTIQIGKLIGSLIILFLLPTLFAWIVWCLTGKNGKALSITFNIVLTLILLGHIEPLLPETQEMEGIQKKEEESTSEVSKTDDPEKTNSANNLTDSLNDILNKISESNTGKENQFVNIIKKYAGEMQSSGQQWRDSFNAVLSPRILDCSLLNSENEFKYQKNVIRLYIEESNGFNELTTNTVSNLKKRLSVLGEGNKLAINALKGASKQYLLQQPILEPLITAHIEYGSNILQILDLLQVNRDKWSFENDELKISNKDVRSRHNELLKAAIKNEATINTLSIKLDDLK